MLMSSGLLSAGEDRFSVSSNGTVVFNLTNAMEMFTLEETGPAQYQYTFTVDMQEFSGSLVGVTSDVTINALNGNNQITVMGSYPRNLTIFGGNADDDVFMVGAEVGGNLRAFLRSGDNSIDVVGLSVAGNTAFGTSGGNDEVVLSNYTSGNVLAISTGAGYDSVTIADLSLIHI